VSGSFKLSIVIPVFNEEEVISEVLQELLQFAQGKNWEIIVVDDGSTDNTAEKIAFFDVKLIRNLSNKGYGASLKAGIRQAGADHVLIMDGDGQHNPGDIEKLVAYAEDYHLVVGSRSKIFHSAFWRMPGKWLITSLANYLTRQKIPDLNSGFRIFRKKMILKYLPICPDRFSFSTTSLIAFLSDGHPVKFVDIEIRKRIGKSTVTVRTGLETILLVLRIVALFNPLRIFIPVSFLLSSAGIIYFFYSYLFLDRGSISALFLFLIGTLIFFFGLVSDQIARFRRELTGQ
jgi:glycosyltransferase involved in cell wall biosynthesis